MQQFLNSGYRGSSMPAYGNTSNRSTHSGEGRLILKTILLILFVLAANLVARGL